MKFLKLVVSALLAFQIASLVADGKAERSSLRQRRYSPERAEKIKEFLKSPEMQASLAKYVKEKGIKAQQLDPTPFQGWWQNITRGNQFGFGAIHFGVSTFDMDSFIFIDTETLFEQFGLIVITTLAGTPYLPRQFTNVDYDAVNGDLGPNGFNFYTIVSPTEIVEVGDVNSLIFPANSPFCTNFGLCFDPTFGQSTWSLKLQLPDMQSLCCCIDSEPDFQGFLTNSNFFKKIDQPQQPVRPFDDTDSAFPEVTNPVAMAKYIYNALTYNHLDVQNIHYNDQDYRTFYEREEIFRKLLDEGLTFETPIRALRVSQPGEHYVAEFSDQFKPNGLLISSDVVTDIFTDGFSFATTGATVQICGFKGPWKHMNGTYVNGVSITEENAIPNPSPVHVDVNQDQTKGTFRNVYNHFQLRFDSSDAAKFPRNSEGLGLCIKGHPRVKVTHRITADMEYPAFFAAIQAMFYKMYRVSQHTARLSARFKPGSIFLFNTWQEMKDNIAVDNYWGNNSSNQGDNLVKSRTAQAVPSGFFNNVTMQLDPRTVTTYNDPFGLTQLPGSKYDYNIVMANYVDQSSIKNLYWAIAGTPAINPGDPTAPNGNFLQFNPTDVGYKPVIPGSQKAEFVGALGNVTVINGKPVPQNPDADHYTLLGDSIIKDATDVAIANGYYIAIIDQSLTGGKKVGYLRWLEEGLNDPGSYLYSATFPPNAAPLPPSQGGTNKRYGREAASQVFSNITRYFNDQQCNAVILDIRSNNGGIFENALTLAEFFGDDRAALTQTWSKKDNGNSELINLADPAQYSFVNDVQHANTESFSKFYVQQNEATYPGSVFHGSPGNPKKVIVLTDYAAASTGDVFPHLFLGENLDGNLGSNTTGIILGDIDGRLKGSASNRNPVPVSLYSNRIYDVRGNPFPPIKFTADFAEGQFFNGNTGIPYNIQSDLVAPSAAPSLKGTAGGNPLPNDWSTNVWPALGLIPAPIGLFDPSFPKGQPSPDNRSSWRDPWLEQAILAAVS